MNDPSSQLAAQPVEQLPIPLFDGVVLAARAHDGAIYLALRDLCATLGLALRAQQRRIRAERPLPVVSFGQDDADARHLRAGAA